ncbi:major facilitator superfamily domain-containing protein [Elsinoe ampelina]|uniref:Major facilitator superfamily domain-containing protein n=1 Tax=Elsinoe ampelina TaxID=302913 RepID=A0A6A6GR92_9PEZI|nr:major facilitator superfamily domain-containing protein [Elsinoe ampelina]
MENTADINKNYIKPAKALSIRLVEKDLEVATQPLTALPPLPRVISPAPGQHHNNISSTQSLSSEQSTTFPPKLTTKRSNLLHLLSQPQWTPPTPPSPPPFSLAIVLLYAWVCTTSVALLYYNQPMLDELALSFTTTQSSISLIPTVMQAGSATGLALICPMGDMFPRRPLILALLSLTALSWTGLALTSSLPVFTALSFLVALTVLSTQLLLPLVGDIAPPSRRAFCLSVCASGITLGIVLGRVGAGAMASSLTWRGVYWFSLGTQGLSLGLLWWFMPDYPVACEGLSYVAALKSVPMLMWRHPAVGQMCLVFCLLAATNANFWTTLTFLLVGEPYGFGPARIGLFGLFPLFGAAVTPVVTSVAGRRVHSLVLVRMAVVLACVGMAVGTFTGTRSVVGPMVQATLHDAGFTLLQVAGRDVAFAVDVQARGRINTALTVSIFVGNLIGTALGGTLFTNKGWVSNGAVMLGIAIAGLGVGISRGPRIDGWVGWKGSWKLSDEGTG